MIAHIKGTVLKKTDKGIIVDTGNIGYFVFLTNTELSGISESQEVKFFIHSNIREDSFDLYGFSEHKNLEFFKQLISVSRIGPKVALEIMETPTDKIKSAIINEDEDLICRIPGIGKKTAKRLILELKDKIEMENLDERPYRKIDEGFHNDAITALLKLGYQKNEIINTLKSLPAEIKEAEEVITYFIRNA
jgi:Holliday junction DNA helicase RuvA